MRVKKIENTSSFTLVLNLTGGNSVRVPAGGVIENVDVVNLGELGQFVRVEQDLSEIPAVSEGKKYLKG